MSEENHPTSINLSKPARSYVDWVREQFKKKHKIRPSRTRIIEMIVTKQLDLDEYPMPESIKEELLKTE